MHIITHNTTQWFGQIAKWLGVRLRTKCLWVRTPLLSPSLLRLKTALTNGAKMSQEKKY